MPVTPELIQQIEDATNQGYSTQDVFKAIADNPKYADVSAQITQAQKGRYSADDILTSIKSSPSLQAPVAPLPQGTTPAIQPPPTGAPAGAQPPQSPFEPTVPAWGQKSPTLYGLAGAGYETVKPVLGLAGMLGGGAIGAAGGAAAGGVGAIPGAIAGGGLGYAGGEALTRGMGRALGVEPPASVGEEFIQTGKDVASGAMAEVGGQVLGAGIQAGVKRAVPVARKLYESAIKPPPSMPAKAREKVIKKGLELAVKGEPYRPTEKAVFQTSKKIYNLVNQADDIVKAGAKKGDKVPIKKLADAIDDVAESQFGKGPFPKRDLEKLNALKDQLIKEHGSSIPADAALDMKKQIYRMAERYYKPGSAAVAPAQIEAEKGVARAIKSELETIYPATGPINREAAELIDFAQVLERAAGRAGNREIFGLLDFMGGSVGASSGGLGGAAVGGGLSKILTGPQTKSMIAKQIMKAAVPDTIKKQMIIQLGRYGVAKATGRKLDKVTERRGYEPLPFDIRR